MVKNVYKNRVDRQRELLIKEFAEKRLVFYKWFLAITIGLLVCTLLFGW